MDRHANTDGLVRGLGPWGAASLVTGTIIGTGVFLKSAPMAQLGGSALWVLAAWGAAGVLSLVGALTYAELGAMYPAAGGEYVFLREGYGRFFAFLYGWTRFWIGSPGSIAAYAVGASGFVGSAIGATGGAETAMAVSMIAVFTALNCLNVTTGGGLQTALTALKLVMIAGLAIGSLAFAHDGSWSRAVSSSGFPGWTAFGTMVLAALWAFDGWNNLPMAAGEVRDPSRNLPRALVGGSLAVLAIYAIVNIGYFYALPFGDVASSRSDVFPAAAPVAAKAASSFLGGTTQVLLGIAMAISALSAMNGSILTGARVPFAVARDGMAPKRLAALSEAARVPAVAVIVQGAWATVLALSGRFDELTNAVIFASWLFYGLNAGSVLLLRRRDPQHPRPFRVPGYPVLPLVFVALAVLLIVNSLVTLPLISLFGVGMTAIGALVFVIVVRPRLR